MSPLGGKLHPSNSEKGSPALWAELGLGQEEACLSESVDCAEALAWIAEVRILALHCRPVLQQQLKVACSWVSWPLTTPSLND